MGYEQDKRLLSRGVRMVTTRSRSRVGDDVASKNNNNEKGSSPSSSKSKSILGVAVFALFIDLIGFTMILPLFPSILAHYKKTDTSGAYDVFVRFAAGVGEIVGAPAESDTVLMGGLLGSVFCFLQFLSAPILGAYSDVVGRKKVLLLCMGLIAASHLFWLFASTFALFILSRLISGLARANVSLTTTIICDDLPPEERPKGMAFIGIAFSFGFVIGPAIGAFFPWKSGSFQEAALACMLLSLTSLLIIWWKLEETLSASHRAPSFAAKLGDISHYVLPNHLFAFKSVSVGKELRGVGLAYFLYIFIYSGLEFTLTFLTETRFGFTRAEQGKMFACLGILMAFLQGTVTRRLKPWMEHSAAMLGMLFMIPAFIILSLAQDVGMFAIGLFCYSVGSAVCGPSLTSMLGGKVPRLNERGVAIGIFRSLGALARVFGPLVASSIFWRYGPETAYLVGAGSILLPLVVLKVVEGGVASPARKENKAL
ncbi:Major facilitator superfamily domain-containing protein 10 [Orchesella cincta]|uniref:Major facilitator superfamily domain-containing protein 10 n=1 Tax=Orchesella cincta TaxID=48709 RepID=A0A1D2MZ92_ORCCI|nr:Major facilitator superfamily domain-containing protein 10 [Orchesella cincta]